MIDTLMPDMIRDSLKLVSSELETARQNPFLPAIANNLIHSAFLLGDLVQRHWEFLRDWLTLGMDHDELIEESRKAEFEIRGILSVTELIISTLQDAQLGPPMAQQFVRLKDQHAALRGFLTKAEELRVWAETPMPPVDVSSIPRTGNPLTGEGYRPADRILEEMGQKRKQQK